jgi:hypothetical protein
LIQPLHPAHPDADQINTFVEGAASAHQRERMLAHLAECSECREMVFLLRSEEEPAPAAAMGSERVRRRWFLPLGLAGAALACGITGVVYLRVHPAQPVQQPQTAMVNTPETAPKAVPETASHTASTSALAERNAKRDERRPGQPAGGRAQGAEAGAAGGAGMGAVFAARPTPAVPTAAVPAPPLASPAAPKESPPQTLAENLSPALKSESANQTVRLATSGRAPAYASGGLGGLHGLRIEHDHGPDDGRSEIAGRVTDATGAVIANATVIAHDAAGIIRQTTTDAAGRFSLAGVAPGHYDVTVTAKGFETGQQVFDLKARDLASLDSILRVGAEAESVAVEVGQAEIEAKAPALGNDAAALMSELPGGASAASRVAMGKRVLSIDTAGTLFLSRNGGKKWKKAKPAWTGKVTRVALASASAIGSNGPQVKTERQAPNQAQVFEITTDSGAVWISEDGAHWRPR